MDKNTEERLKELNDFMFSLNNKTNVINDRINPLHNAIIETRERQQRLIYKLKQLEERINYIEDKITK